MDKLLYKIKALIPKKLFKILQPLYHFLMAYFSALLYGNPSEELIVIGVTGTTGKTTSVYLIAKTLAKAGIKTGYTSTAMFNDGKCEWLNDKKMTMIGRMFMQKMLRNMVNNGCKIAIVETTSEGVSQFRHRFIDYDILVFTGLYPEHIDSHGSFENYKKAKGRLFEHLKNCKKKFKNEKNEVVKNASGLKKIELERVKKTIIINKDDEHKDYFLDFWAEEKILFGKSDNNKAGDKDVLFSNVVNSAKGLRFKAFNMDFELELLGKFNAYNASAAIAAAKALGVGNDDIKNAVKSITGVPGRFEKIEAGQDFTVIVDYAFEPNAVNKLYETVNIIEHNKIIHVLGSTGGGRDISRRPKLGAIAGENADLVIVTNEDPYDDDPEIIIDQVALGAEKAGKKPGENLLKISDRREAIRVALEKAVKNDIVLITGKGSEQAICVKGGEKESWDDRAITRGILQGMINKK